MTATQLVSWLSCSVQEPSIGAEPILGPKQPIATTQASLTTCQLQQLHRSRHTERNTNSATTHQLLQQASQLAGWLAGWLQQALQLAGRLRQQVIMRAAPQQVHGCC